MRLSEPHASHLKGQICLQGPLIVLTARQHVCGGPGAAALRCRARESLAVLQGQLTVWWTAAWKAAQVCNRQV